MPQERPARDPLAAALVAVLVALVAVLVGVIVWQRFAPTDDNTQATKPLASITPDGTLTVNAVRVAWSYSNLQECLLRVGYSTAPDSVEVDPNPPSNGFGRATITLTKVLNPTNDAPDLLRLLWTPTSDAVDAPMDQLSVFVFAESPDPAFNDELDRAGCPA